MKENKKVTRKSRKFKKLNFTRLTGQCLSGQLVSYKHQETPRSEKLDFYYYKYQKYTQSSISHN